MLASEPVVVKDLVKKYDNLTVLDNINFTVKKGEVFGYLGPNGAGKTTTMRILTGLSRNYGGECLLFGYTPAVKKSIYSKIGVLFEEKNLYERLTGLQNLEFFSHIYDTEEEKIFNLLDHFGLLGWEQKKVSTYSKGMKQRLLICRTLLHEPELLFLDEPTDGLDPHSADVIIKAIKEFVKCGKTVFLSSHNMDEVNKVCNRVAFLKEGKIISIDTPDILKKKYGQSVLRIKIITKLQKKLANIITAADKLVECGENVYLLDLTYKQNDHWQKLNKLKAIPEVEILSIHSCEASLKEVFKKITS